MTNNNPHERTILVFGAHNDDQLIGVGGTIAKYTQEGIQVRVYIFSYGESSHPHYKKRTIAKIRQNECSKSDKILGIKETVFLGLKEGSFEEDFTKKHRQQLKEAIEKYNPEKMFLHSRDDPHPDHRAVHKIVNKILDDLNYQKPVYTYEIWNPFTFRETNAPKLVVDITQTFPKKLRSFYCHESQRMTMLFQVPAIYFRALFQGLAYGYRYVEVFLKVR